MERKEARQLTLIGHLLHTRLSDLCGKHFFNFIFYNNKLMKSYYLHFTVNDTETLKVKKLAQGFSARILTEGNVWLQNLFSLYHTAPPRKKET